MALPQVACNFPLDNYKTSFKKIIMAVKMHILHFKDMLLVQSCMHETHVYKDHQRIYPHFSSKEN